MINDSLDFEITPELFVPKNLLDTCKGLQGVINSQPPDEQDSTGEEMRQIIGDNPSFLGHNLLEIHTHSAFGLPDGLSLESEIWPVVQYGELRVKGWLGTVGYFRMKNVRTLSWVIMEPTIREAVRLPGAGTVEEDVSTFAFKGDTLRRPLHLPVGFIESVMIAGR